MKEIKYFVKSKKHLVYLLERSTDFRLQSEQIKNVFSSAFIHLFIFNISNNQHKKTKISIITNNEACKLYNNIC
jgi:hypothetical protein